MCTEESRCKEGKLIRGGKLIREGNTHDEVYIIGLVDAKK